MNIDTLVSSVDDMAAPIGVVMTVEALPSARLGRAIVWNKSGKNAGKVIHTTLSEAMSRPFADPELSARLKAQGTTAYRVHQLFLAAKNGVVTREDICAKGTGLGNWATSMALLDLKRRYGLTYKAERDVIIATNAKDVQVPQFGKRG
jgi:hypothetical protein